MSSKYTLSIASSTSLRKASKVSLKTISVELGANVFKEDLDRFGAGMLIYTEMKENISFIKQVNIFPS